MPHSVLGRAAGLLVPLFSLRSTRSWGIGDIGDIRGMAAWLQRGHQRILQLLPINDTAPDEASPYSALTAMAIHPQFITMPVVDDFVAAGGEAVLEDDVRDMLETARREPAVNYGLVRRVKRRALAVAFDRFWDREWTPKTRRAADLQAYVVAQQWWLDDYALFRALHTRYEEQPWMEWPEDLRRHDPTAVAAARTGLAREVLFYQYVQWIADDQWRNARRSSGRVALFGDFPFMVSGDSADVWARQQDFMLDASVGVPPDPFSETGQDWGLPAYRWDRAAEDGFVWLRQRIKRCAELFDGYRIDHLAGFYRTYIRPRDGGEPRFFPAGEREQLALGERLMALFEESGVRITAEDLGTVPGFVRDSLARLRIPGYRVQRWEREWHEPGQPFRDPSSYPSQSVATSGTHDTEPVASWWESLPLEEREKLAALPALRAVPEGRLDWREPRFTSELRDVYLEMLYASGSDLLILPIQDVFGWRDRINEPATVDGANWTYVLPWPINELDARPEALDRANTLQEWSDKYGRW